MPYRLLHGPPSLHPRLGRLERLGRRGRELASKRARGREARDPRWGRLRLAGPVARGEVRGKSGLGACISSSITTIIHVRMTIKQTIIVLMNQ